MLALAEVSVGLRTGLRLFGFDQAGLCGSLEQGDPVMVIARTTQYNNDINIVILPDGRTGWLFRTESEEFKS